MGLAHIRGLRGLRELIFCSYTGHADEHFMHICALPVLSSLDPRFFCASDAGVAHLRDLANLQVLELPACHGFIGSASFAHLDGLTDLRELSLCGSETISHAAVRLLDGLVRLTLLNLGCTRIGGEGPVRCRESLARLAGLTQPKSLRLYGLGLESADIEIVRKSLSHCGKLDIFYEIIM